MKPVIALLTDFGLQDHYVGTMKGVILGICDEATLVDITHDIPPQDVLSASLELRSSYRFFPAGTVFVVVVDPAVGTARRGIAASAGGYRFVAPDNGVLTGVLADRPASVVELTNARYALPDVTRTFEGRDRFAPAAGWLARGTPLEDLGPRVDDVQRLEIPAPQVSPHAIAGCILRVDRFGNLITNIDRAALASASLDRGVRLHAGEQRVDRFVSTYAEVAEGEVCALIGSSGFVEIAANRDSAARRLGLGRGATVRAVAESSRT
ncbi:MAG: SAM-dependent chlorinase/fluorinase [Acidobacteria bacterium]|nr:SAM-dependent chlorinase/fluorinase [Acidobacteriota bacterium]MBI3261981.1 SAM-dependent chlorinase/fluorinase [Acidobacteriota bacterium]